MECPIFALLSSRLFTTRKYNVSTGGTIANVKFPREEYTKETSNRPLDVKNFVCQGLRLRCLNGIGYSNRIVKRAKNETRRAVLYTVFNS